MTTPKRRIVAVLLATLLLLALTITFSPGVRTSAVAAFDEVHYRVWRFGGDCGINVPMLERTKFEFLVRLMEDMIDPADEKNRFWNTSEPQDLTVTSRYEVVEEQAAAPAGP